MILHRFCVTFILLIAPNVLSVNLSFFDFNHLGNSHDFFVVQSAYADSNDNSTFISEEDPTTLNEKPVRGQCDPSDPTCSGTDNGVGQCDPSDPTCSGTDNVGGQCDPSDPTCSGSDNDGGQCDPSDPTCSGTDNDGGQCDPSDPTCSGTDNGRASSLASETESSDSFDGCFDGIDNDEDGLTDADDEDCGGGTPVGTFPGDQDQVDSRVTIRPNDDVALSPIVVENGPPTVFAKAIQNILAPIQAEAIPVEEVICDDGLDNNDNGLTDREDPHCGSSDDSTIGLKFMPSSNATQGTSNSTIQQGNNSTTTIMNNNNSTIIPASELVKHDMRTAQFFQYKHELEG
jgi:hypothetical protein